jgi:uncharacterized protein (DUF433 family)
MNAMLAERIVADPEVNAGTPFVRDTGISVAQVLDALAERPDSTFVLERFPALDSNDIRAAVEFARESLLREGVENPVRYIADLGWTPEYAAELRLRLRTFADDWDDPEMDVYDRRAVSR